jgi:diguanylate cyclase (GGDEF)-like protein
MLIDQTPLFVAAGISAGAMSIALLTVWLTSRADRFLAVWSFALLIIAVGVVLYMLAPFSNHAVMAVAFWLQTLGFVAIYLASFHFAHVKPRAIVVAVCAAAPFIVALPIVLGANGLGLILYNIAACLLLTATAYRFWTVRWEARTFIIGSIAIYGLVALSFATCAIVLLIAGDMTLAARPDNPAEYFNSVMSIVGITAIGGSALSINQFQKARRHREAALTDTLTGLLNRRALFEHNDAHPLRGDEAIIAFDLDHFKSINDRFGHAVGDRVLQAFAQTLRNCIRQTDIAARIGGEEFIVLLNGSDLPGIQSLAERVRQAFASITIDTPEGPVSSTTSSGIAIARPGETEFDALLLRADRALYKAKALGRNRIVIDLDAVA